MAEIRTVTTLTTKRDQLLSAIAGYERALDQARADLAHVTACIAMFDTEPALAPRYADINRLFARRELSTLCKAALAKKGAMDTRELALHVMAVKGFDVADAVLAKAITYRVVQALRMQWKRGLVGDAGRRRGRRVWTLGRPRPDAVG